MPRPFGLERFAVFAGLGLLLADPAPARSELIAVTQVAVGMECPECARTLRLDAKKLDGVDDVSTSWNRRVLTLRFAPANKCTLTAIRMLLRQHHFVPGEAEIIVAGQLARDLHDGPSSFQVSGSNAVFQLAAEANLPSLFDGVAPGTKVVVRGRIAAESTSGGTNTMALPPLWVLDVEGVTAEGHAGTSSENLKANRTSVSRKSAPGK